MDFDGCTSAAGNYSLGIFELSSENYEELDLCLKEIIENLRSFKEVKINDTLYKIAWYLGGDMKFISIVLGLTTAFGSAHYPCPWCKCKRSSFRDYKSMAFSIKNIEMGARTLDEANNRSLGFGHIRTYH